MVRSFFCAVLSYSGDLSGGFSQSENARYGVAGLSNENDTVTIKRYASRKLYDADAKEYVTLEDIARYIRDGREVKIIDKKTGEDLTRQYLVQIIAEFESQGGAALPMNVLTDLVRHYQDQASAMTPAFLSQVFEAFKEQQERVMSEFGAMQPTVFDPSAGLKAMQSWQDKQTEFFNQAMRGWAPGKGDAGPKNSENDELTDEIAEKDRMIAKLQAEIEALKKPAKGK